MEATLSAANFLKEKLEERQLRNKSYSLRAFASNIGLSPGGLAQIFSGKKKLSLERAFEIAEALKLPKDQKKLFLLATELDHSKKVERRVELYQRIKKINPKSTTTPFDLSVDQFKLISEWYGLAILECLSSYGSNMTVKEVSRHFGITINETSLTIERLQRLELIEIAEDGQWSRNKANVLISSKVPSEIIRSYYRSVANRSHDSYEKQTPMEKVSAAETFTFDIDQLEEVRKLTDEYLDNLTDLASKGVNRTHTYQALLNIFRLNEK